jgi:UDP-N-acetylglucosamine 2-epimerase
VEKPDVLVLYAESSGLGRAAVLAARQAGIPSFAVQHGIMYPQYFSHEHEREELERENEGEAVPIPSRTAVFGSLAKDLLMDRGGYREDRIVVTGSPKFDALVETAAGYDTRATRRLLGVPERARMLLLASRFSAVGPVFEELVNAVERLDDVWLLVKPHQAEAPTPYVGVLSRLRPTRSKLVEPATNLLELLVASDGLITVDSFASSEALVLGRPVLVVNLPSNLASLVDRGVALGVERGDSIEAALRRILFEDDVTRELEEKRRVYLQEFAFGADGRSTERIVRAILESAEAETS